MVSLEWDGEVVIGWKVTNYDKRRVFCVSKGKRLWSGTTAFYNMPMKVAVVHERHVTFGGTAPHVTTPYQYVTVYPTGVLTPDGWLYTESGLYEEWR